MRKDTRKGSTYNKKAIKLSNCNVQLLNKGDRDFFIDAKIRFPFNNLEEYNAQCKHIKEELEEFYLDFPYMRLDAKPIIILNDLTESAIIATKTNFIVINITCFTRKPIANVGTLDLEQIESFIEKISTKV